MFTENLYKNIYNALFIILKKLQKPQYTSMKNCNIFKQLNATQQ